MKAVSLRSAFVFILALMVFPVFLPACKGKVTEEDAVKAVIQDMAGFAQKKDVYGVMKHVAPEYSDSSGNNYDSLKGMLAMYFIQPEGISVFLRKQHIEVKGDKAAAVVNAIVSRGKKVEDLKDLLPTEAAGFVFDLSFKKVDGDWKLTSALWRRVVIAEVL